MRTHRRRRRVIAVTTQRGRTRRAARRVIVDPASESAGERSGTGTEPPESDVDGSVVPPVIRWFGFVDLSGFTRFIERRGHGGATDVLSVFRSLTRNIAAHRGVRVAKWLGDGAMLVGVEAGPLVAMIAELLARFADTPLRLRAGIAGGPVILFEGDDYIGHAVNVAARLCDVAGPGEVLCERDVADHAPDWVAVSDYRPLRLKGLGRLSNVCQLQTAPGILPPPPEAVDGARRGAARTRAATRP
jgi:class 3 adenylate cyclase